MKTVLLNRDYVWMFLEDRAYPGRPFKVATYCLTIIRSILE